MHDSWNPTTDVKRKDIQVAFSGCDYICHSATILVLDFNYLHDLRRDLVKSVARFSAWNQLSLLCSTLGIVEVKELAVENSNANCLLMIKTENKSYLVIVALVARLFTPQAVLARAERLPRLRLHADVVMRFLFDDRRLFVYFGSR